jgi:hypothetical protein
MLWSILFNTLLHFNYPDNGRIVIGDNRNPLQLHRTQHYSEQALIDKIDRITFLVTMKLIPQRHER